MTRSELMSRIGSQFRLSNAEDVETADATILLAICTELAEGGRTEIRGLGSFTVNRRSARIARDPETGEKVSVPAKEVPHFKAGTELRQKVGASAGVR